MTRLRVLITLVSLLIIPFAWQRLASSSFIPISRERHAPWLLASTTWGFCALVIRLCRAYHCVYKSVKYLDKSTASDPKQSFSVASCRIITRPPLNNLLSMWEAKKNHFLNILSRCVKIFLARNLWSPKKRQEQPKRFLLYSLTRHLENDEP